MKKTNKGFTIVELVVVIAVVAVLAAVLIPTFTSIIKKANDSAYLQERQNQRIEDLAEKIDNQNYLTWDDFEGKIAEAIAAATPTGDHLTEEEVKTAIQSAIDEYSAAQANTRLTEDQVKKIVEKSLEGQVTMEQITALVNKAAAGNSGVNVATVQSIVNQAIAGMSANPGLSAAQVSQAISNAIAADNRTEAEQIAAAVAAALEQYAKNNPSLTAEQVAAIVDEALAAQTPASGAAHSLSADDIAAQENEKVMKVNNSYYMALSELTDKTTPMGGPSPSNPDKFDIYATPDNGTVLIKLIDDIHITGSIGGVFGTLVIDLNGYKLIAEGGLVMVGGNITIKDNGGNNGGFISGSDLCFDGTMQIDCALNIEGGKYDVRGLNVNLFAAMGSKADVTITGGVFYADIQNGKTIATSGVKLHIQGGSFNVDPQQFVTGYSESQEYSSGSIVIGSYTVTRSGSEGSYTYTVTANS